MKTRVSALLLVLALAGCGSNDTSTTNNNNNGNPIPVTTSGVQGQVTRGPLSPVSSNTTANSAPLAGATVVVQRPDGTEVGRQTSDSSGNYQVGVAPGSYVVVGLPTASGQFPIPPAPQNATVNANQFTVVNLNYDTGIR